MAICCIYAFFFIVNGSIKIILFKFFSSAFRIIIEIKCFYFGLKFKRFMCLYLVWLLGWFSSLLCLIDLHLLFDHLFWVKLLSIVDFKYFWLFTYSTYSFLHLFITPFYQASSTNYLWFLIYQKIQIFRLFFPFKLQTKKFLWFRYD